MALGWIGSIIAFGVVVREAVDQVKAGDGFELSA
jgi:hypothetical protein